MEIITYLANFIGVVAFAISGTLKAIKHKLDILGIIVLAIITAVGGGIIRDVIINRIPNVLKNSTDIYVAIISAIIIYILYKKDYIVKNSSTLLIMDAIGLAIFAVIGASIGVRENLNIIAVAILSTLTGVGGGVIRDLLVGEIPIVLKEDVYAILCFLSAIVYVLLLRIFNEYIVSIIVFLFILIIRIIVIKYKLNLPK